MLNTFWSIFYNSQLPRRTCTHGGDSSKMCNRSETICTYVGAHTRAPHSFLLHTRAPHSLLLLLVSIQFRHTNQPISHWSHNHKVESHCTPPLMFIYTFRKRGDQPPTTQKGSLKQPYMYVVLTSASPPSSLQT